MQSEHRSCGGSHASEDTSREYLMPIVKELLATCAQERRFRADDHVRVERQDVLRAGAPSPGPGGWPAARLVIASSTPMPAVEKKVRARYYRRCDPREPVEEADDRYVAIDELAPGARGRDWIRGLATRIELSDTPVCELFTGLPGSGKTTELRRLVGLLADPEGARMLPVLIDAEQVIDLYDTLDVPDVLMAIVAETERRVLQAESDTPRDLRKYSDPGRLWSWLIGAVGELLGAEVSLPEIAGTSLGSKLVLDMKTRRALRHRAREAVADHMTTFLSHVHEALAELDRRARAQGYVRLVVIFDSLEKLWGISSTWRDVLESAERVFATRAAALHLPVHVVYTIPMCLILRMALPVALLPMLRLHDRDGERAAGFAAARELVRRRVPDAVLDQFFGAESREARVEELIAFSGGSPREVVRLLRDVVAEAELSPGVFARILALVGDEYRRTVLGSAYPLLARIAVEKQLPLEHDQREWIDPLLQNGLILAYENGARWYDLHPAVSDIPGVAAAIRASTAVMRGAPPDSEQRG